MLWQQTIADLIQTIYLLVSEERRERERRERHRVRINRRASEEDSSGKFMQHLRPVH